MKWLSILIFITPLYFANANIFSNNGIVNFATSDNKEAPYKDSLTWIEDFKSFRKAVYANDITAVKKYFRFPVSTDNNEIWYLLLSEKEFEKKKTSDNKTIPFKEEDLVKYYKKIFTTPFVNSLMKVKTEILYKKNETETPLQYENKDKTYKMYVTFDKETNILSFNLAYKTIFRDKKGNMEDNGESNVIYNFTVEKDGHIFFKEIRLAG